MAIRVAVVWVALCLYDAKDNTDDALADDARSETRIGRPKQFGMGDLVDHEAPAENGDDAEGRGEVATMLPRAPHGSSFAGGG